MDAFINMLHQSVDNQVDNMCNENNMLSLGILLEKIKQCDSDKPVKFKGYRDGSFPNEYDSYRGYYRLIAIEPGKELVKVSEFVEMTKDSIGNTYTGYKGGEYTMNQNTPVWVSDWGTASGMGITGVDEAKDAVYLIVSDIEGYNS